jgi:hypothetical protein
MKMCEKTTANCIETNLELLREMAEAERKAWRALGQYKFMMFGYWAAIWVHLNQLGQFNKPNPFLPAVQLGSEMDDQIKHETIGMLNAVLKGGDGHEQSR